jgi:polyhydroxyalkanoate synthesis regulator phasin
MAWANRKGMTKAQLHAILKGFNEDNPNPRRKSAIKLTQYTEEELEGILPFVRSARPKRIAGKLVVTKKTEGKIQKLKTNLIKKGQMTVEDYSRLMADLGMKTDRYDDGKKFVTEKEARALIKAMLDESEYIERRLKAEKAVNENPDIKKVIDDIEKRNVTKQKPKGVAARVLEDMRYFFQAIEKETGARFYDAWNWLTDASLKGRYKFEGYLTELESAADDFQAIAASKESQERIRQWLASWMDMGQRPELSANELAVAEKMQQQLDSLKGLIRFLKFREAYQTHGNDAKAIQEEIRNAPTRDLQKAIDVYETQGKDGLIEYLADKDWGVIKHGYSPEEFIEPHVSLRQKESPKALGKGHLKVREGVAFGRQERTLFERYASYLRQILRLEELDAPIRHMVRTFDEARPEMAHADTYSKVITQALHEAKGYKDLSVSSEWLQRLYSQVIQAVFLDPGKWLRNKFQNPAFHTGALDILRSDNVKLSPQQQLYFRIYVSQKMGMIHDYLMQGMEALPGMKTITQLAKRVNMYPWTDESNRMESFYVSINKARRAIEKYREHKDVERLLKESGADVLEPLQQREALRLLAQKEVDYNVQGLEKASGEEAFMRFVAREVTNNVHFMYDRSQRSAFEQGEGGILLGNLMAFPRGTVQRIVLQARKLKSGRTFNERWMGARTLVQMTVISFLVGEAFKKVTGREQNPYSIANIIQWVPGGLSMSAAQEVGEAFGDMMGALQGDKDSLNRFITALPRLNTIIIPFYDITVESLEALADKKNIDVYALRKMRDAVDEEYKVRDSAYSIKRNFIEKLQHALFGGEVSEEKQETKPAPKYQSRI